MFKKIEQVNTVVEYKIKNYTEEDLNNFTTDILRYTSQLIDLNNYAYTTLGLFRELIDFYIKPLLYRWTINTRATNYGLQTSKNNKKFEQDFIDYTAKINQLNLGRELYRLLLKMFLEDAVFGYWLEDKANSTIFYLPSAWCVLKETVNGNWTYRINAPRISQRDIDKLPKEIASLVAKYKTKSGDEALAPVPYEKVVCFKYNDHTNVIFPPFTYVLLLILDLTKAKKISLTKNEQDATNLIQMLIPVDEKDDDHLKFTDPIIAKYAIGLQELLATNNAILPTPMELSVLDINKHQTTDTNIVQNAMDSYNDETGLPKFGGTNTAAEMKRSLENAAAKVFIILDQISSAVNLKMKYDGFIYDNYEFVYEILHMNQFNRFEVIDDLLKQSQAGAINKFALEAARGKDPCALIGQHYTENVVFRTMLDDLIVPPSSHTQATTTISTEGGRPAVDETDLTDAGTQTRDDDENAKENRNG
jgi:hypothetical protein